MGKLMGVTKMTERQFIPDYEKIGRRLLEAREASDNRRTQKDCAKVLGVMTSTYYRYEKGHRKIKMPQLEIMAKYLNRPLTWLLDQPSPPGPTDFPAFLKRIHPDEPAIVDQLVAVRNALLAFYRGKPTF